MNVGYSLYQPC